MNAPDLTPLERRVLLAIVEGWRPDSYHRNGVAIQSLIERGLIEAPKVYVATPRGVEIARQIEGERNG